VAAHCPPVCQGSAKRNDARDVPLTDGPDRRARRFGERAILCDWKAASASGEDATLFTLRVAQDENGQVTFTDVSDNNALLATFGPRLFTHTTDSLTYQDRFTIHIEESLRNGTDSTARVWHIDWVQPSLYRTTIQLENEPYEFSERLSYLNATDRFDCQALS